MQIKNGTDMLTVKKILELEKEGLISIEEKVELLEKEHGIQTPFEQMQREINERTQKTREWIGDLVKKGLLTKEEGKGLIKRAD